MSPHISVIRRAQTKCKYGHEYTEANTYRVPKTGGRHCRECHRAKRRTARAQANARTIQQLEEKLEQVWRPWIDARRYRDLADLMRDLLYRQRATAGRQGMYNEYASCHPPVAGVADEVRSSYELSPPGMAWLGSSAGRAGTF